MISVPPQDDGAEHDAEHDDVWQVHSSRYLLERWWLKIREDSVELPNGTRMEEYHILEMPDWTAVVCLTEASDELVLVEQYRHGLGRTSLELPSGVVEPGEAPLDAAQRELREETGFDAADWTPLGTVAPDPSRQTNAAHFFLARRARRIGPPKTDAGEIIRPSLLPIERFSEAVASGRFVHGLHLAAVLTAARTAEIPLSIAAT